MSIRPRNWPWKLFILLGALFFLIGFFYQYHLPQIKRVTLTEIERLSQKHSPVRVWPEDLEFKLFPLGIRLINVKVLPKDALAEQLAPLKFKNIDADINLVSLIQGKFRLSELSFNDATVTWIQKKSALLGNMSEPSHKEIKKIIEKLKLSLNWDKIYKIPVDALVLNNIDVQVKIQTPGVSVKIKKLSLSIFNRYKAILVKLSTKSIMAKKSKKSPTLKVGLETQLLIEDKGIRIAGVKIIRKKSFIIASGKISGDITNFKFNDAKVKARSHFLLSEIRSVLLEFFPKLELPLGKGSADIDINLVKIDGINSIADIRVNTKNIKINDFIVGQIQTSGRIAQKKISITDLSIKNSAGKVTAKNSRVDLGESISFSTNLTAKSLEITQLLVNLTVPKIPMYLLVDGPLACRGTITPLLKINCNGELTGSKLDVWSGDDDNESLSIVKIENFKANGVVTIDDKKVTYDTDVSLRNMTGGHSKGTISYAKGFDISYKAKKAFLNEIDGLANLRISGETKLSGRTQGDSDSAIFSINASGSELYLEDFLLGKVNTQIRYKSGKLRFNKIRGRIGSSRYSANLVLNLPKDTLSIVGSVPFLDIDDLERSISTRWKFPFKVSGTGSAKFRVSGPYDLRKLNFDLKSDIFRGRIAGESFDVVHLDLYAKNQEIKSRKISIHRGDSQIELKGKVDKNDHLDGVAIGRSLRIEQFENINKLNLNLSGVMDMTLKLSNSIQSPVMNVNGRISNMVVGDQPAEDSFFNFKTSTKKMSGSASFIGGIIKTNFQIPISKNIPLKLFVKTKQWDFSHMFNIFSNVAFRQNYLTELTSEFYFNSPSGMLDEGKGRFFVEHFKIQRGPIYMKTKKPGYLEYNAGRFRSKDFKLYGRNTYLELFARKLPAKTKNPLNLSARGKVDLSLASLLTPFLKDLRGTASVNIDSSGTIYNPDIRGSIYLQNGLVSHPDFPHPFTGISADILFNKKNLLLNSIKGQVAGGTFSAEGQIQYHSLKKIPIDIRGHLDKVTLNVPEGFKTRGSGSIYLKGTTFPYTFGGLYSVRSGDIRKDFDITDESAIRVQPSHFLPKFLTKDNFSPISLNLDVEFKQPIMVNVIASGTEIVTPVVGKINVSSFPDSPLLTGKIVSEGEGRFTFRSNEFNIRDAIISFSQSPPSSPNINVSAYSRVKDYDIDLQFSGSIDDPKMILSSQPQLPETEILSLLALGMTTQESDTTGALEASAESTSFQLTSALINQQLGLSKEIKKRLGLKFEISSDYDADEATSVHRFTFKKQWTPNFGASASRSIGTNPINRFKVEYKLSNELSVIGNYETKEQGEKSRDNPDKLGLDLEYKVEFGE